jgi:ABC-type Fe3+-hydroxamate transport system substrate-binding protein
LTRAITLIALTCLLLAGVAVASILGRDSVPAARPEAGIMVQSPVSNREAKKDRLSVAALALAAFEPQRTATLNETLRQAFASSAPSDIEMPKVVAAPAAPVPPKPKAASKPAVQKSYALLSDVQIAGIKQRLRLSSAQESYWPPVEDALRAVARKIHATRQADPSAVTAPIDPEAAEVQQLKSAAMPLLFQLREDQKQEVRSLARIIGLEKVASQI